LVGCICYWLVGYAFAYGDSAGGFIGASNFLLLDGDTDFAFWFFQFVFSATAATVNRLPNIYRLFLVQLLSEYRLKGILLIAWLSLPLFTQFARIGSGQMKRG
jgi:hypothetical protein